MADQQIGNVHGVAAAHIGAAGVATNLSGTATADGGFFDTDSHDIAALKTRLASIDAGYYTTARLNEMSYNDMVYAVRLADAPDSISQ